MLQTSPPQPRFSISIGGGWGTTTVRPGGSQCHADHGIFSRASARFYPTAQPISRVPTFSPRASPAQLSLQLKRSKCHRFCPATDPASANPAAKHPCPASFAMRPRPCGTAAPTHARLLSCPRRLRPASNRLQTPEPRAPSLPAPSNPIDLAHLAAVTTLPRRASIHLLPSSRPSLTGVLRLRHGECPDIPNSGPPSVDGCSVQHGWDATLPGRPCFVTPGKVSTVVRHALVDDVGCRGAQGLRRSLCQIVIGCGSLCFDLNVIIFLL